MPAHTSDDPADAAQSRLSTLAKQLGVDSGALDEVVHDAFSAVARDANNDGLDSQIAALLQHLGPDEVEQEVRDAASPPATAADPHPPADGSGLELPQMGSVHVSGPPNNPPQMAADPMNAGTTALDVEVTTTEAVVNWTLDAATAAHVRDAIRRAMAELETQARQHAENPRTSYGAWYAAAAFRLHTVEDATLAAEVLRAGGPFSTYDD
ncbi:hypothetical protein NQK81_01615 [Amycolatopsis roodepoortensis]|uniref:hypothetical protein n=1 Tax=Amycolatopsis roodepoortensis TaxID=700274 RepID=UPI00214BEE87|nr:hypothetical protein [Amycolatopsis roodepoortensis]UUV32173.1 hypothetical protein NQK81_01615 [Amycolatopsis roodepoortensis]